MTSSHPLEVDELRGHEPIIVRAQEDSNHIPDEPQIHCTCGWAGGQESFFRHIAPRAKVVAG